MDGFGVRSQRDRDARQHAVIHVDARPTEIEVATLSDIGRQRSSNQDSCGDFTGRQRWRLLVVADGMGGHQGGETASGLAAEAERTSGGKVAQQLNAPPPRQSRWALRASVAAAILALLLIAYILWLIIGTGAV